MTFRIGHDGLTERPRLAGGPVENGPAHSRDPGTRCVNIFDEDKGNRGSLAGLAACQAGHEDRAITCELDVPGRDGEGERLARGKSR